MQELKHWQYKVDDDGLGWLTIDVADSNANILAHRVLEELEAVLHQLDTESPQGLILQSGKDSGFVFGADVTEFLQMPDMDSGREHIRWVHGLFQRIEDLGIPTVALIKGQCLGGGTELALACDYRVACDDDSTRIGLPEVMLGLFPGYGGSTRSVERVGPLAAMDMMLTGRGLRARQAKKIGLADQAVPERQLANTARWLIRQRPAKRRPDLKNRLANHTLARPLVARLMRKQVAKRARQEHYPAPYRLIEHWQQHAGDRDAMFAGEVQALPELLSGSTAQNLIRAFTLQDRLKALGKQNDFRATHVHVIGAGVMGGDIAAWCAMRGLRVSLQDRGAEYLSGAMARANALFKKRLRVPVKITAARDRLMPDLNGDGVRQADVVIEAIFENADAKRALYQSLQSRLKPGAVLATNTSSIPLDELNTALDDPGRLVGLHFFNPVAKMQLVEIVSADGTDADMAAKAAAFTRQIGKLPLPTKSLPGFLINRVLTPYLLEAMEIAKDGVSIETIDEAALAFGMPMGPVELADVVGLDICLSVANNLAEFLGFDVPDKLEAMVTAGKLGKKTGQGFYQWSKGKAVKSKPASDIPEDLQTRLALRFVNEARAALADHVVEDADLIDAGLIFGTGFAPFRGGPLHYANGDERAQLKASLDTLAQRYGERFKPAAGWDA